MNSPSSSTTPPRDTPTAGLAVRRYAPLRTRCRGASTSTTENALAWRSYSEERAVLAATFAGGQRLELAHHEGNDRAPLRGPPPPPANPRSLLASCSGLALVPFLAVSDWAQFPTSHVEIHSSLLVERNFPKHVACPARPLPWSIAGRSSLVPNLARKSRHGSETSNFAETRWRWTAPRFPSRRDRIGHTRNRGASI